MDYTVVPNQALSGIAHPVDTLAHMRADEWLRTQHPSIRLLKHDVS